MKKVDPTAYPCCWNCVHGMVDAFEATGEPELLTVTRRWCDDKVSLRASKKEALMRRSCAAFAMNTGKILLMSEGLSEWAVYVLRDMDPETRVALLHRAESPRLSKPVSQFHFPLEENQEGRFVLGLMWFCAQDGAAGLEELDTIQTIEPIQYDKNGTLQELKPYQKFVSFELEYEAEDTVTVFAVAHGTLDQKAFGKLSRRVECYLTVSNRDVRKANEAMDTAKKNRMVRKGGLPVLSEKEWKALTELDIFRSNQLIKAWQICPARHLIDERTGRRVERVLEPWYIEGRTYPASHNGLTYHGAIRTTPG